MESCQNQKESWSHAHAYQWNGSMCTVTWKFIYYILVLIIIQYIIHWINCESPWYIYMRNDCMACCLKCHHTHTVNLSMVVTGRTDLVYMYYIFFNYQLEVTLPPNVVITMINWLTTWLRVQYGIYNEAIPSAHFRQPSTTW